MQIDTLRFPGEFAAFEQISFRLEQDLSKDPSLADYALG